MNNLAQVTTVTTVYSWINTPIAVALLFGFAGAVFIAIYLLPPHSQRRVRQAVCPVERCHARHDVPFFPVANARRAA